MLRRPPISTRTYTLFPTRRSSDLDAGDENVHDHRRRDDPAEHRVREPERGRRAGDQRDRTAIEQRDLHLAPDRAPAVRIGELVHRERASSEEHTSELRSLMRISYAVFCLKNKRNIL